MLRCNCAKTRAPNVPKPTPLPLHTGVAACRARRSFCCQRRALLEPRRSHVQGVSRRLHTTRRSPKVALTAGMRSMRRRGRSTGTRCTTPAGPQGGPRRATPHVPAVPLATCPRPLCAFRCGVPAEPRARILWRLASWPCDPRTPSALTILVATPWSLGCDAVERERLLPCPPSVDRVRIRSE